MPPVRFRLEWRGGLVERVEADAAERGVRLAAEHLLGESRKLVPLEEGTLERSGTVSTDGMTAAVSYDTPYAVYQHERLDLRHDPGRQAKYLEQPYNTERGTMTEIVAAQIRRALRE